jgi:hypothetical protein
MNWRKYKMPDDINGLDVTDAGLKGIFGSRFHDETEPVKVVSKKETTTTATAKVAEKPMDAQWEPVKENTWMDNLKACAIWAIGFGCLTFLFFSWQQAGLMDASVAVPTMLTCTALGGWGVGRNAMRGKR